MEINTFNEGHEAAVGTANCFETIAKVVMLQTVLIALGGLFLACGLGRCASIQNLRPCALPGIRASRVASVQPNDRSFESKTISGSQMTMRGDLAPLVIILRMPLRRSMLYVTRRPPSTCVWYSPAATRIFQACIGGPRTTTMASDFANEAHEDAQTYG